MCGVCTEIRADPKLKRIVQVSSMRGKVGVLDLVARFRVRALRNFYHLRRSLWRCGTCPATWRCTRTSRRRRRRQRPTRLSPHQRPPPAAEDWLQASGHPNLKLLWTGERNKIKTYYKISQSFPFALFVSSVVALSDYIIPIIGGARKKGYRQRGSFSTNAEARKHFVCAML